MQRNLCRLCIVADKTLKNSQKYNQKIIQIFDIKIMILQISLRLTQ